MKKYDASSIKIYKGLNAVRKRPGMYIGNTDDGSGLHKMVFEAVDNAIDESLAGYCNYICVTLYQDGSISIFDNGRGMPTDFCHDENLSAAEIIMTVLHAGAKFDEKIYRLSGGLHGVGISVVNALSKELRLRIFRSGLIYEQLYLYGKPRSKLKILGHTDKRGTEIKFFPDPIIFKVCKFDHDVLFHRLKELSFLNPNISVKLVDQRTKIHLISYIHNDGGIKAFIDYLNHSKSVINKHVLFFSGKENGINIDVAMQWTSSFNEEIICYTNNIHQKDGGSHLIGLKSALTKIFKTYIEVQFKKIKNKLIIQGNDIREGLVAILSIYMANPKFSSQIKDKLISSEAKQAVESFLLVHLKSFLHKNQATMKLILNKILSASKAREAAKKARDLNRQKNDFDSIGFCSKLSDCQERNPCYSELFLVEGDSAGGSAKQARDRRIQAVLPLKGKILNVERVTLDRMFLNSELMSIISVLKCGIGENGFNKKNLRYHKIILMTDADVDGSHIRTLLMTFFYRHIPQLIENGHIFISRSPLYMLKKNNNVFYIKDKVAFDDFLFDRILEKFTKFEKIDFSLQKNIINLYKIVESVLDKLSFDYPKIFFENLVYFKDLSLINNSNVLATLISYKTYLNENLENNQVFYIKDKIIDNVIDLNFVKYGVLKEYKIHTDFFKSQDFLYIKDLNENLLKLFFDKSEINILGKNYSFFDFGCLIKDLKRKVMSEYTLQRYKGLGEMNPSQLWDTTMNPKTRNLYRIKIKDAISADNIFSVLMGENIEKRKDLIEKNSRFFSNLDF